jgi:hypothetical protein
MENSYGWLKAGHDYSAIAALAPVIAADYGGCSGKPSFI